MTRPLLLLLALPACSPVTVMFPEKSGIADGVPDIATDTTSLDFGVATTGFAVVQAVTVSNEGTGALDVALELSFGGAAFTLSDTTLELDPGEQADVTVTFLADDPAAYEGTLDLSSDDPDEPLVRITLAGEAVLDADGDGYTVDEDCDDDDADVFPGATETWYDGVDADCDDASDFDQDGDGFDTSAYGGDDCDDEDPSINPDAQETWYDGVDQDCDNRSDDDRDGDGYTGSEAGGDDCDDEDAAVSPGTLEVAGNGVDDDCDGETDEALSSADADGDGYSEVAGDCNDSDATISPGATETYYDGLDQDCDGASDWDADADGSESSAYGGGDCDDADAAIGPDATETWYDDVDQNCDGNDDDQDADGFDAEASGGTDCDDTDATVYPGATETWYDGIDQDCDGAADGDQDGDGHVSADHGGDDCDDTDAASYPGAPETWYDGVDQDCDGNDSDQDGDGVDAATTGGLDCDDTDATVNPSGTEDCDGVDDDCDGTVDDGVTTTFYTDADGDGYGDLSRPFDACSLPVGYANSSDDCDDAEATTSPGGTEVCDGVDNDCDGGVDDGVLITYYEDADGDGHGGTSTTTACSLPTGYATAADDCDDTDATTSPSAVETCDDEDDDCDSLADEGLATSLYYADADGDGYGDAATSVLDCAMPSGYVTNATDCDDADATSSPGLTEATYDLADNDCDGVQDEMDADTESGWTVVGTNASDAIGGAALLATDDLDGDGDGELIIGAPGYDVSYLVSSYSGAGALGFHDIDTAADPADAEDAYLAELGLSSSGALGTAAVLLGDIDGDGVDELAVGATGESSSKGVIYTFDVDGLSWLSAPSLAYDGKLAGDRTSGNMGYDLAVGDFDGDSLSDLVTSAPAAESGKGRVYLFLDDDGYGDDSIDGGDATAYWQGGSSNDHLGYSVAAGDWSGDGTDDLIACAPDRDDGGTDKGACYVIYGGSLPSDGTITGVYDAKISGSANSDQVGLSRESLAAGDLDADGRVDLAVGVAGYDGSTAGGGGVFVYAGASVTGSLTLGGADQRIYGEGALGAAVSIPGDVDGDVGGVSDLLLGATSVGSSAGAVYLFSGGQADGLYSLPDDQSASWSGAVAGEAFGTTIHGLFDLDADGVDDFAVGAPGSDEGASDGGKVYVVPGYP